MDADIRYFHGGFPGLKPGDIIRPMPDGQRRNHNDCAICRARNSGEASPLDSAPAHPDRVYITTDRLYGRFYASLAVRGDLYVVRPVGAMTASDEDHFPTWIAAEAEVVSVYDRAVQLTAGQRRQLLRRWIEADYAAAGNLERWRAMSPADQRREFEDQWAWLCRKAVALTGRGVA